MSTEALNFILTVQQNFDKALTSFNNFQNKFGTGIDKIQKSLDSVKLNAFIQNINSAAQGIESINEPGMKLSSNMYELQAMTGVAGEKIKQIEEYARNSAKTFGGSAADGVESYKLILGQLTPEIAKVPKALDAMGKSTATTSKLMGGDIVGATELLTTAMNQYQVSTDDPIKASEEMAKMMNVMAAAAGEGSAELPTIKRALEQAGMGAKMANVSFEETNAAIQILDKAGKKGSEGGVALRNVLVKLGQGKYIPKDYQEGLQKLGIDTVKLADKNLSLADRLKILKPAMKDSALLSAWLGEGADGATKALMEQIPELERLTGAVTGTNTAYEQAAKIMESPEEKNKRLQAQIDDFKISLFNGTNGLLGYASVLGKTAGDFANLMPIFSGAGTVLSTLTSATKLQALWTGIVGNATAVWTGIQAAFNVVMAMNPIVLVVLAVIALVAAIVWVASATEGWGKMWQHTVNGAKLIFQAYVELAKAQFNTLVNGIMIGVNKIQIAWYKFKNAVGMGDKNQNQAMINQLNADVEQRKESIKAGYKKAGETALKAKDEFSKAFNSVKWKKDKKEASSDGISAPGVPGVDPNAPGGNGDAGGSDKGKKTNEAVATGGTKHNYITINLKDLIGVLNISGKDFKDSANQMTEQTEDALLRLLASATTTAG
ncbi:phage tail tape measure protein [Flavobacterium suncheonense]|uniref:phage tail tape measure protein n=1 Tax=Flavobacterium suncheonense TaxID=350894 RepID=UPI0004155128|nr:phage tail tape measure protein [Flavobacterium suncheonense]